MFVGEVAGIDCRRPLDPDEVAAIEAGMDRYAVLVFRDQHITDDEQLAFTRHFGELEAYRTPGHIRRRDEQRLGPGMADFSNLDKDGSIIAADDRVWFFKLADRLWHFRQLVPPGAGEILAALGARLAVLGRQHRVR